MTTYAIGDIQGCADELERLLEKVNYSPASDRLLILGDMINRGPDNVRVLDRLMAAPDVQCVLGNHDLHFLAIARGNGTQKRRDTLDDLLNHPDRETYVDWLLQHPLAHYETEHDVLAVHAGVPPNWSLEEVLALSHEVDSVLRSPAHPDFFRVMYGNEPDFWEDRLDGMDRLRLITNYLTRIRFAREDGTINLTHKTDVAPPGFSPWFELPLAVHAPTRILFGHWAALGGVDHEKCIGLDTGCVWGRTLTAMRLEDGKRFSVDASKGLAIE